MRPSWRHGRFAFDVLGYRTARLESPEDLAMDHTKACPTEFVAILVRITRSHLPSSIIRGPSCVLVREMKSNKPRLDTMVLKGV